MSKQPNTFDEFFSECYLNYQGLIQNYIAIRICRPYEAEDLAQDVFVRLWEHKEFVNRDTIWSLLFTIARNLVTDRIRRYYKQEDFISYIYNNVSTVSEATADSGMCFREVKTLHDEAIKNLPVKRRQIYRLSFYKELSCPAIADRLSISPRTVEGQLLSARKFVRTYLNDQLERVS